MTEAALANANHQWYRRPEVRFPIRLLLLSGLMAAIWAALRPIWSTLEAATASLVAWASNLVSLGAKAEPGAYVSFGHGSFRYFITDGCTGLSLAMMFGVAVLAYPATKRQQWMGLAVGVPLLFVVNIVRLVMLGWTGVFAHSYFETLHTFWWQGFHIVLISMGWFAWAWWVAGGRSQVETVRDSKRNKVWLRVKSSSRIRKVASSLAAFLSVFGLFGAIGLWAHGVEIYGRLLHLGLWLPTALFWNVELKINGISNHSLFSAYGLNYALLAAVFALFVASPGIEWRKRLGGAFLIGIPTVFLVQCFGTFLLSSIQISAARGGTLSKLGIQQFAGSFVNSLMLAAHIGVPLIAWNRWISRARVRALKRRHWYDKSLRHQKRRRRGGS